MAFTSDTARAVRTRAIAAILLAILLTILVATLLGVIAPRRAITSSLILSVIGDEVLVQPAPDALFRIGKDGETLNAGMTVQTRAPNGRAVLTFMDGSTEALETDATVSIDELSTGTGGELIVRLAQTRGKSWAHVQPLLSPNSQFTVRTPSGTAVARGTSLEIEVEVVGANGEVSTKVNVFQGQVDVVAAGKVQPVTASRSTEVVQGSAPQAAREFSPPPICLRMELSASALMSVTDPYDRSAGQTRFGTVSQIPRSIVTAPQEHPQVVDIFSPTAGDWEVGIVPRGDGGAFQLVVSTVVGKTTGVPKNLTGFIEPGQRLVTHIHLGDGGQVDRVGAFQQLTQTRAKIVDVGSTTTAPLPQPKIFAPVLDQLSCGLA